MESQIMWFHLLLNEELNNGTDDDLWFHLLLNEELNNGTDDWKEKAYVIRSDMNKIRKRY